MAAFLYERNGLWHFPAAYTAVQNLVENILPDGASLCRVIVAACPLLYPAMDFLGLPVKFLADNGLMGIFLFHP